MLVRVAATPVPLRKAACPPRKALSRTVSTPLRRPAALGLKETLIVHDWRALSELPQLLLWVKSPLAVMPLIFKVADPLLLRVNVLAALALPTVVLEKVTRNGERTAN